ncbi:hypothetical protein ACF3DV_06160 [Chlorogloeopsis fritschii PCC 9212]|uniref:Uncharacterized protein n=1 Tax=Chlorogloeopsis fritschii PCC 6912 TaxID=211165 RepID=A0A433NFF7_CHLFR|nr:hypothetical protein [Chlorogloeopsis fritschii]RUR80925.1 hypothetical protein PCC6912_29470 [Chlorogloeopsis fritschii PCC 6912]
MVWNKLQVEFKAGNIPLGRQSILQDARDVYMYNLQEIYPKKFWGVLIGCDNSLTLVVTSRCDSSIFAKILSGAKLSKNLGNV